MTIKNQQQHIVPATYLKHFATNSFVHVINYADRYRKNIQRKGIRDKIFCKPNYYDWKGITLEKKFSQYEGSYNEIIQQLTSRTSIDLKMKNWISQWMHMSKMRSEYIRDLVASVFTNIEKSSFSYEYDAEDIKKHSTAFGEKGQLGGKIFQFENFETNEYLRRLNELTMNFLSKEWVVYVSESKNFITSDNPGFSFTNSRQNQLLNLSPVFGDYNTSMDEFVIHYYPLTSKMCLCLKSFNWNDQSTEDQIRGGNHKMIQFKVVPDIMIEEINDYTKMTSHKMVIANQVTDLDRYF